MSAQDSNEARSELFPSLFTPIRLREHEDAFDRAMREGADCGAGTLFHVGRFDAVEFSVVLEPAEPLKSARRAFFAGMNALAETLALDCPPEKPLTFDYPGMIRVDGGLVGAGRLGWPEGADENEEPPFLVFAVLLQAGGFQELGFSLEASLTTLEEEGVVDLDPALFAARFSRHLMFEVDDWQENGFKGVGARYLQRLPKSTDQLRRGIDGNGDLLVHPKVGGAVLRTPFLPLIKTGDWSVLTRQGAPT